MSLIACRLIGYRSVIFRLMPNHDQNKSGIPPEQAFGQAVRKLRQQQSLSQEELGFRADLHRTFISDIERGARNPTVRTIWKLGDALQLDPSDIVRLAFKIYRQYLHQ